MPPSKRTASRAMPSRALEQPGRVLLTPAEIEQMRHPLAVGDEPIGDQERWQSAGLLSAHMMQTRPSIADSALAALRNSSVCM